MQLIPITRNPNKDRILYDLLSERSPEQSISHKEMPAFEQHVQFINSNPYLVWYFLEHQRVVFGAVYLTNQRETGIQLFKKHIGKGYGELAIRMLMEKHPGKFLANINPENTASIKFFEKFNSKLIQNTYEVSNG